jgi:hypothetical protein
LRQLASQRVEVVAVLHGRFLSVSGLLADRIYAGLFLLFLAGARPIIGRPSWIG